MVIVPFFSLVVPLRISLCPLPGASVMVTMTGPALSAGAVAANEGGFPAASRMPLALVARATVKLPTAVSTAPAPSAMVSVATDPLVDTEPSVPPDGTLESAHGADAVEAARVSENVALTWSTFPLPFVSNISSVPRIGAALSAGAVARSEERRVGEERRSRWSPDHSKKKTDNAGCTGPGPSAK